MGNSVYKYFGTVRMLAKGKQLGKARGKVTDEERRFNVEGNWNLI